MNILRPAATLLVAQSIMTAAAADTLAAQGNALIGDLTVLEDAMPRRLAGYGIVLGLAGTGDRSLGGGFSSTSGSTPTVSAVVNMLRNFQIEVPPEQMRSRNVAAVVVTADVSPYLRAGGKFDVQVSSLGDATSLRGGVLFTTMLQAGVGEEPIATGGGRLVVSEDGIGRLRDRSGTSGRVPDGGSMDVTIASPTLSAEPRLVLLQPNLAMAQRITSVINGALGAGSAVLEDPGAVRLTPTGPAADNLFEFVSTVNALTVANETRRVVIDRRDGTVVAGGGLLVGPAAVTHSGITVTIADSASIGSQGGQGGQATPGLFEIAQGASVQEVAQGLHATGARPTEIAAIFRALHDVGALTAEVVER